MAIIKKSSIPLNKGFTLVETVIALLVLSLIFSSVMTLFNYTIKNSHILKQKVFAEWVLHNHVIMRQSTEFPETGKRKYPATMGNYDFVIMSDVVNTSHLSFRKSRATIFSAANREQELSDMVSYYSSKIRW